GRDRLREAWLRISRRTGHAQAGENPRGEAQAPQPAPQTGGPERRRPFATRLRAQGAARQSLSTTAACTAITATSGVHFSAAESCLAWSASTSGASFTLAGGLSATPALRGMTWTCR